MMYLAICAFFTLPIVSVIYFIVSTVGYRSALKKNKQTPDTYSAEEMKSRKRNFIISTCLATFMVVSSVSIVALFYIGIAYM
ncbi:MAG: hypothetical protein J6A67_03480 [Clostridia bacterium]|nr:hypothetical protein [Clostridia bacterium]